MTRGKRLPSCAMTRGKRLPSSIGSRRRQGSTPWTFVWKTQRMRCGCGFSRSIAASRAGSSTPPPTASSREAQPPTVRTPACSRRSARLRHCQRRAARLTRARTCASTASMPRRLARGSRSGIRRATTSVVMFRLASSPGARRGFWLPPCRTSLPRSTHSHMHLSVSRLTHTHPAPSTQHTARSTQHAAHSHTATQPHSHTAHSTRQILCAQVFQVPAT